jgi:hypothetical protein
MITGGSVTRILSLVAELVEIHDRLFTKSCFEEFSHGHICMAPVRAVRM